jgi:hypothetical protein
LFTDPGAINNQMMLIAGFLPEGADAVEKGVEKACEP